MKAVNVIAGLLVLLGGVCCSAATTPGPAKAKPTDKDAQQAYESLIVAQFFAFGGVGEAGTISPGEKAFSTVLASTNALSLFRKTLAKGTTEARLYALFGLRRLDRRSFDSAAKDLVTANPKVTTMTGCIVWHEQAATLVKQIAEGRYDVWLSKGQD